MNETAYFGTGFLIYGLGEDTARTLVATQWLALLFVPAIPIRRARCEFLGEQVGPSGARLSLAIVEELPLSLLECVQTYCYAAAAVAAAIGPAALMLLRVQNRAANQGEFIAVLLSAAWPIAIVHFIEKRKKQTLLATWSEEKHTADKLSRETLRLLGNLRWARNHYFSETSFGVVATLSFFLGFGLALLAGLNQQDAKLVAVGVLVASLLLFYLLDRLLFHRRARRADESDRSECPKR